MEQIDYQVYSYFDPKNPVMISPNSGFVLSFEENRETLFDGESYENFLTNAISLFRKTRVYKHYKGYLLGLGLDRCQVHPNITSEMATVEMHHNILNIHDIAFIITEHILDTTGSITTFDLISHLRKVHTEHKVALVMLSLTPHQAYHDDHTFFLPPSMCFGKWYEFLEEYKYGIKYNVARKLINYLEDNIQLNGKANDNHLLDLREKIIDWSRYNDVR